MENTWVPRDVVTDCLKFMQTIIDNTTQRLEQIQYKMEVFKQNKELEKDEKTCPKSDLQKEWITPTVTDEGEPKKLQTRDSTNQLLSVMIKDMLKPQPKKVVEEPAQSKRGRPETIKDCHPQILKSLLNKWEKEIKVKLEKDQRSDAQFATVGRYVKKIPDVFLKYVGSKCQFKSQDVRVVLRSYLKTFTKGFIKMFPWPKNVNINDLFLDFIILCFPESKVEEILVNLLQEGEITHAIYESKMDQVEIRIKASKLCYKDLARANVCLRVISKKLPAHLTILKGQHLKKVHSVFEFFLSSEEWSISEPSTNQTEINTSKWLN